MENKSLGLLFGAFLALLVGIVLIGTIASQSNLVTEKTNVLDETTTSLFTLGCRDAAGGGQINESLGACNITVTNSPTTWKTTDCPISNVVVGNSTWTLTESTDYNLFTTTGVIQLLNTSNLDNATFGETVLIDYTYCADDYLNASWGRSTLDLVAGFFAIALLLVAVGLFYQVMKNEGLAGL